MVSNPYMNPAARARLDDLLREKNVQPIRTPEDLKGQNVFQTDEELQEFLDYTYRARRADSPDFGPTVPGGAITDPAAISDVLVVRIASDRSPHDDNLDDDLVDLLGDIGAPPVIAQQVIARAVTAGYLEYTDISSDSDDAAPTAKGMALLVEQARHNLSVALQKAADHDSAGGG